MIAFVWYRNEGKPQEMELPPPPEGGEYGLPGGNEEEPATAPVEV